ncbi:glucose-fructose oxidoreductase [Rhodopirellula maiorica SM1]|uniref:Glucose-fructose oxidoreductase n=1 Tax=Rhodopirellula maiorica SM1 TaxID=1265738 RepID=M5RL73_9BACT|nr:Gfo/Idh/MocA family oxidoreductase [Rhodopirellula maiorica]EMI19936.1 glucose-fructose oxidoreductase [Rhodopirellula maiorica SM1]
MNNSLNRRQFAQLGTASMAIAAGTSQAAAADQANSFPDDSQIQPVGGQSIKTTGKKVPLAPPGEQPPNLELPKTHQKKYGWAVVGLGQLALGQIMPAFGQCELSKPTALVSGHADKAKTVAQAYGVDDSAIYNYQNFDKIAGDDRIDVVYIVLPNSMHAEFTIRALEAGKHVLCEKPMAVSIDECRRMIDAANKANRKLMIAYRLHYEPFNRKVMQLCKEKRFGEIKTFSGSFCINVEAPNIRLSAELGGGPVGDVGVYPINATRYVTGEEPIEVFAQAHQPKDAPRFAEVPESVSCLLRFPSGVLANLDCSFGTHRSDFYRVACADGVIELSPAFSYNGQRLMTHHPSDAGSHSVVTHHEITEANHFASEMDHFSRVIRDNRPPRTPGEEGLADMRILAAMAQSIRDGKPTKVKDA